MMEMDGCRMDDGWEMKFWRKEMMEREKMMERGKMMERERIKRRGGGASRNTTRWQPSQNTPAGIASQYLA